MYKIVEKEVLSDVTKLVVVEAPQIARKARAGQFVIVISHERGERIPLTIADYDRERGTITLIFQEVGKSTMEMARLGVGDTFRTRKDREFFIHNVLTGVGKTRVPHDCPEPLAEAIFKNLCFSNQQ